MARITITVCLFSSFFLSHLAMPSQASIIAILDDLPISVDEVLLIPESEINANGEPIDSPWKKLISPACRIGNPWIPPHKMAADENKVATCPVESEAAFDSLPSPDSATMQLNRKAVWKAVNQFLSTRKETIVDSLDSTKLAFHEGFRRVSQSVSRSFLSVSQGSFHEKSIISAKNLVPSVLISCQRSAVASEPIQSRDSPDEACEIEWEASEESLIGVPGTNQDSYWQYYEDCDRWNVDFADLLLGAEITSRSRRVAKELIEPKPRIEGISPSCLIVRIIAAQNLSNWLYRRPRIAEPSSVNFSRWTETAMTYYSATAKTIKVISAPTVAAGNDDHQGSQSPGSNSGLIQRINPVYAGQVLVSEIMQWAGADPVFARVSSIRELKSAINH